MPNINIAISDELHKKLKVHCALNSCTLKEFVISALEEELALLPEGVERAQPEAEAERKRRKEQKN